MLRLQIAVDTASIDDAIVLLTYIAPNVDIIQAGTALIKQAGVSAITRLKHAYPSHQVLADMKTMDRGEFESDMAFSAGADYTTVLAVANDFTIKGAVMAAHNHGKSVIANLLDFPDKVRRAKELEQLGVHGLEIHCGLDEQAYHVCSLSDATAICVNVSIPVAIAGGVTVKNLDSLRMMGAKVAVIGRAIFDASDPASEARNVREAVLRLG